MQNVLQVMHAPVAEYHAGQIDGEKAAAADAVGKGEHQNGTAGDQQRVQAGGQLDPVDQTRQQHPPGQTAYAAYAELLHKGAEKMPAETLLAGSKHGHQGNGQEDRHGVVGAGLDLQRGAHPLLQVQSLALEQGEHGRCVSGADNGAQQQPLQPVQIQ